MTLTPIWPYTFERPDHAPGTVRVTRWEGQTAHTAVVTGPAAQPTIELANARSVTEVVEVLAGPDEHLWRIETSPFSVEWPEGFSIDSPPAGDTSMPFCLFGPADALIYLQGPRSLDRIPPLTQFVAPGQTLVDHRTEAAFEAVELAYQHEGTASRQWHHLVALTDTLGLVVTAQSPAAHAAEVRGAAESVARSVRATA
ncbi:hypothetical protein [Kitasatospora sp. NPDC048407]|uniref:hypothetical protein n=1 Tax=Kitasatospora sp. NPDC048407 TaxID=3364051 RepID=UPI00371B31DA